jgi:hypothetical protein
VTSVAFPYGVGEIEACVEDGLFTVKLGVHEESGPDLRVVLGALLDDDSRSPRIRALAGLLIEELLIEAQTRSLALSARRGSRERPGV